MIAFISLVLVLWLAIAASWRPPVGTAAHVNDDFVLAFVDVWATSGSAWARRLFRGLAVLDELVGHVSDGVFLVRRLETYAARCLRPLLRGIFRRFSWSWA
jgi:hypothetical protein